MSAPQPGCYVDSHWGQYACARVIEVATEFGWRNEDARELAERHLTSMGPSTQPGVANGDEWEQLVDASDEAEAWLNEHCTREGFSWGWNDGDFGFYPDETED